MTASTAAHKYNEIFYVRSLYARLLSVSIHHKRQQSEMLDRECSCSTCTAVHLQQKRFLSKA